MDKEDQKVLIELGLKIKNKRKKLNMTQFTLSQATGIDRSYLSLVERGKTNITYLKLIEINKLLNIIKI